MMKSVTTKRMTAYRLTDHPPAIRPGVVRRAWMDESPSRFAYRCLPLTIANSFGWELLCPTTFEATWNGGMAQTDIAVTVLSGDPEGVTSHFGTGVLTFHTGYLFRTEAGISLMAMGPPNLPKDSISALAGVVETSWAPYPFTMNWRFTRPNTTIRFEEGEPFCFIVPVSIGTLEGTRREHRGNRVGDRRRQADEGEQLEGTVAPLLLRQVGVDAQRLDDLLPDRDLRIERVERLLEDDLHVGAQVTHLGRCHLRDIAALEDNLARGRRD